MANRRNTVTVTILLAWLVVMGSAGIATAQNVIYVDDSAAGIEDGTNWTNAYRFLQDALAEAGTASGLVEIRVAQGIYTPDEGGGMTPEDPVAVFQLISGVDVKGGFAGVGATAPNARDHEKFVTILSGDLAGDDVDNPGDLLGESSRAENSLVVVSGSGARNTLLSGFTIDSGKISCMAILDGEPSIEGCTFLNSWIGLDNENSSTSLDNCTFKGHWFQAIRQLEDDLTLTDCLFTGNLYGAIEANSDAKLALTDCTFVDNVVGSPGLISSSRLDELFLSGCDFMHNITIEDGVVGVKTSAEGSVIIYNCTFVGNTGTSIEFSRGAMAITNCRFTGNWGGAAIDSDSEQTAIRHCTFSDNENSGGDASALRLRDGGSISNCIIWANSEPAIEGLERDMIVAYSDIQELDGSDDGGNFAVDPLFVSLGYWDGNVWTDGDYHVKSEAGHWDQESQTWIPDDATSPCIDAGHPNSSIGSEPFPNGARANMGAYGATDQASKSYFGQPVCDTVIPGDLNGDCVVDEKDLAIVIAHWLMQGMDQ
jgi:hypothetical protein